MRERDLEKELIHEGVLHTPRLIEAWKKIRRKDFLPESLAQEAALNTPLPIGYGQTISQPYTVAFMIELLGVEEGNTVLDVGSGSGWQTALLAELVGEGGRVYALERIPELKEFGEQNVSTYGFINSGRVKFFLKNGWEGLPEYAPFDRIIVAAAADEVPHALVEELAPSGRLVIPVGGELSQAIVLVVKQKDGSVTEKRFPGFVFVPFVKSEERGSV